MQAPALSTDVMLACYLGAEPELARMLIPRIRDSVYEARRSGLTETQQVFVQLSRSLVPPHRHMPRARIFGAHLQFVDDLFSDQVRVLVTPRL